MTFSIEPLQITQTATSLIFDIVSTTETTATINYTLKRQDGRVIEAGYKAVPIQVLQIFGQVPINIEALNQVLAGFEVTAIEQIFPQV